MERSRYSAEERKANQDAHEARMARFEKSEADARARREKAETIPNSPEAEPGTDGQQQDAIAPLAPLDADNSGSGKQRSKASRTAQ